MPDPRSRDPRKKASESDYDSMIATQIEMANKMAQQNDIDYKSSNFRQQQTTSGALKGGILGGLFAPLPFSGVNQNVFGTNPTKNVSPPSLFDSNPSTSFAGFNPGKLFNLLIINLLNF